MNMTATAVQKLPDALLSNIEAARFIKKMVAEAKFSPCPFVEIDEIDGLITMTKFVCDFTGESSKTIGNLVKPNEVDFLKIGCIPLSDRGVAQNLAAKLGLRENSFSAAFSTAGRIYVYSPLAVLAIATTRPNAIGLKLRRQLGLGTMSDRPSDLLRTVFKEAPKYAKPVTPMPAELLPPKQAIVAVSRTIPVEATTNTIVPTRPQHFGNVVYTDASIRGGITVLAAWCPDKSEAYIERIPFSMDIQSAEAAAARRGWEQFKPSILYTDNAGVKDKWLSVQKGIEKSYGVFAPLEGLPPTLVIEWRDRTQNKIADWVSRKGIHEIYSGLWKVRQAEDGTLSLMMNPPEPRQSELEAAIARLKGKQTDLETEIMELKMKMNLSEAELQKVREALVKLEDAQEAMKELKV